MKRDAWLRVPLGARGAPARPPRGGPSPAEVHPVSRAGRACARALQGAEWGRPCAPPRPCSPVPREGTWPGRQILLLYSPAKAASGRFSTWALPSRFQNELILFTTQTGLAEVLTGSVLMPWIRRGEALESSRLRPQCGRDHSAALRAVSGASPPCAPRLCFRG